jgi:hypothetical protein
MGAMNRFWLSWPQPTEDFRPLTDPPQPAGILGWWCSGYDADDVALLCALVEASNLKAAKAAVRQSWPEAPSKQQVWRIENEHDATFRPGDRFPVNDWIADRLKASDEHLQRQKVSA